MRCSFWELPTGNENFFLSVSGPVCLRKVVFGQWYLGRGVALVLAGESGGEKPR